MFTFASSCIYAILNLPDLKFPLSWFEQLLACDVGIIQIRAKGWTPKKLMTPISEMLSRRNCLGSKIPIVINDYIELARDLGADGVHLGQSDVPPLKARAILGEKSLIGLSTHTLDQVKRANESSEISYIGFGPIFTSSSKSGHADVVGFDILEEVAEESNLPIVAIGGIRRENIVKILSLGASKVALISGLRGDPGNLCAVFSDKKIHLNEKFS